MTVSEGSGEDRMGEGSEYGRQEEEVEGQEQLGHEDEA